MTLGILLLFEKSLCRVCRETGKLPRAKINSAVIAVSQELTVTR